MLDEAAVFLVLLPTSDDVAAVAELGTCEVAVGERLFEVLPRPDVVVSEKPAEGAKVQRWFECRNSGCEGSPRIVYGAER
ncbi:DUF7568 family protein [Halorubrum trueperi]|uniref:Uncharacterized protein n=1 Tax=Halorubrum trueperi TaxID=2004704 RepID=A0ABD5UG92_9EURY